MCRLRSRASSITKTEGGNLALQMSQRLRAFMAVSVGMNHPSGSTALNEEKEFSISSKTITHSQNQSQISNISDN